jgi:hypothetical protein
LSGSLPCCQIADIDGSCCAALRVTVRPAVAGLPEYAALFGISHPVYLMQFRVGVALGLIPDGKFMRFRLAEDACLGDGRFMLIHNFCEE